MSTFLHLSTRIIILLSVLGSVASAQSWECIPGTETFVIHELQIEPVTNVIRMVAAIPTGNTYQSVYGIGDVTSLQFERKTVVSPSKALEEIHDFCYSPQDGLFIADKDGVFYSADNGETWTFASQGLEDPRLSCVACDDSGGAYVGAIDGVYYYSTLANSLTKVFLSENFKYISEILVSGNQIFLVRLSQVFYSTNKGQSWAKDSDVKEMKGVKLVYSADDDLLLYLGTQAYELYIYDLPGLNRHDIILEANAFGVDLTTFHNTAFVGVYRIPSEPKPRAIYRYNYSSEQLDTLLLDGLEKDSVSFGPMACDNIGRLYVGTSKGLYRTTEPVVTSIDRTDSPLQYQVSSYPSPVALGTPLTVSYSLERAATLSLQIKDILGRTIREEPVGQRAPGQHTYSISTAGLEPGMYFYSLLPGNGAPMSGKMVVR